MPQSVLPREPFDWLDDPQLRHGGLRMIQTAIARGWLEGPEHAERRARLIDSLVKLALDDATPVRDSVSACRLLAYSMTDANIRILRRSLSSPAKRRDRRMRIERQGEGGRGTRRPGGPQQPGATDRPASTRRPAHEVIGRGTHDER
jgi:hypothetical protein